MKVDVLQIRPGSDVQNWEPQLRAALSNTPAVAVILQESLRGETLAAIARALALPDNVRLVAVWGSAGKVLHDLVDRMALEQREFGPVTTFEDDCAVEHFVWEFAFPYRGVLDVEDQDRSSLVCYVSDEPAPENMIRAIDDMRNGTIQPADD